MPHRFGGGVFYWWGSRKVQSGCNPTKYCYDIKSFMVEAVDILQNFLKKA